jgi:hypothetical protein
LVHISPECFWADRHFMGNFVVAAKQEMFHFSIKLLNFFFCFLSPVKK